MNKKIKVSELSELDLSSLPDGANYILDENNKPVGVILSFQYYKYLESLMVRVKEHLQK